MMTYKILYFFFVKLKILKNRNNMYWIDELLKFFVAETVVVIRKYVDM